MVQSKHLCSSTFWSVSISARGAQPLQRAEAESLCTLATARSKIYRRAYLARKLHGSLSCSSSIGDFACFLAEFHSVPRSIFEGTGLRRRTRDWKSESKARSGI